MKPGQPCLATTARCDAACSTGLVDVPAPRQRATARSRLQRLADPALALCSTATAGGPNRWHLVDLLPQLVGDLRLLGLQHLAHDGHDVLAARRLGVCGVQVVQRHILQHERKDASRVCPADADEARQQETSAGGRTSYQQHAAKQPTKENRKEDDSGPSLLEHLHDGLLLVHVALGQRHILLRLQVELGGVRVAAPDPLHCTCIRWTTSLWLLC